METRRAQIILSLAAMLMGITALVHIFVGGVDIHMPLRQGNLPNTVQSTLEVIWHCISFHLVALTLALIYLVRRQNRALYLFLLFSIFAFGLIFVIVGIGEFGSLWLMPQWIAFGLVGLLMIVARRGF